MTPEAHTTTATTTLQALARAIERHGGGNDDLVEVLQLILLTVVSVGVVEEHQHTAIDRLAASLHDRLSQYELASAEPAGNA